MSLAHIRLTFLVCSLFLDNVGLQACTPHAATLFPLGMPGAHNKLSFLCLSYLPSLLFCFLFIFWTILGWSAGMHTPRGKVVAPWNARRS